MAEFGERYFREIVAKDRKDMRMPRRYFHKAIVPAIGSKPVRGVTTEDVRAIIWKKKDEGFDAAAAGISGVLRRLSDYAQTAGLVASILFLIYRRPLPRPDLLCDELPTVLLAGPRERRQ